MGKCQPRHLFLPLAVDQGNLGASLNKRPQEIKLGKWQVWVVPGKLDEEVHTYPFDGWKQKAGWYSLSGPKTPGIMEEKRVRENSLVLSKPGKVLHFLPMNPEKNPFFESGIRCPSSSSIFS